MKNGDTETKKFIDYLGSKTNLKSWFKNCQFLFTLDSPAMKNMLRKTLFIFPDNNFTKQHITNEKDKIQKIAKQTDCQIEIRDKEEFKKIHDELYFYPETFLRLPDFDSKKIKQKVDTLLKALKENPEINLKFDKATSSHYLEVRIYGNSNLEYLKHLKKFQKVLPEYLSIDKRINKTYFRRWLYRFLTKRGYKHEETKGILEAYELKPIDYNHASREIERFENFLNKIRKTNPQKH